MARPVGQLDYNGLIFSSINYIESKHFFRKNFDDRLLTALAFLDFF